MKVIRARTAGFCMGVSLALRKLDREIERAERMREEEDAARNSDVATSTAAEATKQNGAKTKSSPCTRIATFGPIIHNPQVLEAYAGLGVRCLRSVEEATEGFRVVIRAHGIPQEQERALRELRADVVDATCPKVKKAQLGIDEQRRSGRTLLLFGEADHPEVRGLLSYAGDKARVFGSLQELETFELDPDTDYFLAAQTTQDRAAFEIIRQRLQERLGHHVPVLETICDATRLRQEEAIAIARRVDAMVVVGGFDSGNTRRLADVAAAQGVFTVHVENEKQLPVERLQQCATIGLTAGASTPKSIIDAAERFLESL